MALTRLRRFFTTGSNNVPPNTSREITPVAPVSLRDRLLSGERGRHEIIRRCREMYAADPRAEGMLRMMARDATRNGFTVTVNTPQAQAIADAAVSRLKLKAALEGWLRLGPRDGDLYLETGVAGREGSWEIAEITRKPTLSMVRLSDDFDRFPDPAQAFAYVNPDKASMGQVDDKAVYFPEFLIVHARWNHDSESRYGSPEFASSRDAWKKLTEGELDVAIRRKTRAGRKYVHTLIGATEAEMQAYIEQNQQALNNPFAAAADFFLNFEGGIQTLDGDARLGEMDDIIHHLQTWSAASVVPLELLAFGENLNRDVLDDKKRQYDETLEQVRQWAADQIIIPILEREWLLHGLLPDDLAYSIGWPSRKALAPAELAALVAAVNEMRAKGWSLAVIWALVEPFMPDEITAEMLFDGMPLPVQPEDGTAESVNASTLAAAETMGAVNRLLGRLDMAGRADLYGERAGIDPDSREIWRVPGGDG